MKPSGSQLALLGSSLLAIVLLFRTNVGWAQSAPEMRVQTDASEVGIGEILHLQLTATSADTMPADARLAATPGFVLRGQSAAPSQTLISINGSRTDRYTLAITWALEAQRAGTFHVGPPSVVVAGVRYASQGVTITVLPAGQAPRRRAPPPQLPPMPQTPFGLSPFDPWKGFLQGFDSEDPQPTPQLPAPTDPKLALDAPRGAYRFLHATVDRTTAVVGEQVTFSVYEYVDLGALRVDFEDDDAHEAAVADFVKRSLFRDDQDAVLAGYASVGGNTWVVKLVRRWALFPLHSGDLIIGPMSVRMVRPSTLAGTQRSTETLRIRVAEPPIAGRPPGYALGDVGRFSLNAQVSPREVDQSAAVGVQVEVSGTGNFPMSVATPAREGVEWLAPEVHDDIGPKGHDALGGKRTFDFVVRLRRPGQLDLGEMKLPYWDPEQKKYEVARASLGMVRVAASPAAQSGAGGDTQELLAGLPAAREAMEGSRAPRAHLDDSPLFWVAGIAAWPLALGVAVAGRSAGRRVRYMWTARRASPAMELKERLLAAVSACDGADARTADAAIARALEAAAVAHAGVNVRGAVEGELVERLARAGVASETASHVAQLLRECEQARFAPDASDIVAVRDRWLRAQGAIRGLEHGG
jgi:hypothetical protein